MIQGGSDIVELSAVELARAVGSRQVSCREVMQAYLAQIARLNPRVNAIVSLQDPDGLLRQADERDRQLAAGVRLGWMHGFPQAPKDLVDTAGILTTQGSPLLRNNVPASDAIIVERARRSGAILIGKTNTPEFGLGSHTYNPVFGTTLNAWDPDRTAGGSSGGAAVALALRMLPVADGSDMMGSLRNPAGYNNVFGLRPSFGRVPSWPALEVFYQQLACEGPMARSVVDLAMLLSVQAGFDARAPLSIDQDPAQFTQPLWRDFDGVRVGWIGDYSGYLPMEPGVLDLSQRTLRHFEALGCVVEDVVPAYPMEKVWRSWTVLRSFLIAGLARQIYGQPALRALMKPELVWEVEAGLALTAAEVFEASVDRSEWYHAVRELQSRHEYLVLPAAQVFPFEATLTWPRAIGDVTMDTYHRWMEVVVGPSLAGLPTIAVPAGFSPAGLPMGLQIVGRTRADLSVLQIAHAYEQATDYTSRRPALLATG